ncbi:unnamed protein product [Hapterophycus canaliculatus]
MCVFAAGDWQMAGESHGAMGSDLSTLAVVIRFRANTPRARTGGSVASANLHRSTGELIYFVLLRSVSCQIRVVQVYCCETRIRSFLPVQQCTSSQDSPRSQINVGLDVELSCLGLGSGFVSRRCFALRSAGERGHYLLYALVCGVRRLFRKE